jgi:hypothetical protein
MRYLVSAFSAVVLIFGFLVYKTFTQPLPLKEWFKETVAVVPTPSAQAEAESRVNLFGRQVEEPRLLAQVISAVEINVSEIANQDQATQAQLFKESKAMVAKLSSCLSTSQLCGQTKENAEGYFDPDKTPEHRNLNRALLVMTELSKLDTDYLDGIDRNDLLRVTKINNDNSPLLALQLLGRTKMSEAELNTVLSNAKNLRGQVRSMVLETLGAEETQKTPSVRANYVAAVYEAISNQGDRSTAFEIQKNLGRFKLEKEEFTAAVTKSCFLRKDSMGEDLWPLLKKNIALQGEAMGFDINPDELCKL